MASKITLKPIETAPTGGTWFNILHWEGVVSKVQRSKEFPNAFVTRQDDNPVIIGASVIVGWFPIKERRVNGRWIGRKR